MLFKSHETLLMHRISSNLQVLSHDVVVNIRKKIKESIRAHLVIQNYLQAFNSISSVLRIFFERKCQNIRYSTFIVVLKLH